MKNFLKNKIWLLLVGALLILVIIAVGFFLSSNVFEKEQAKITPVYDKVAIIQQINSQSRLQTVSQVIQRDVEITLNLGDFNVFGATLLENEKTQTVAVTGEVFAGIDLANISKEDIEIDQENSKLKIYLPKAEVLNVDIIEDKTRVLKEDATRLFNFKTTINSDLRREVNDTFQREVIKQSKIALTEASCENMILEMAQENASEFLTNLFDNFDFEEVEIVFPDQGSDLAC